MYSRTAYIRGTRGLIVRTRLTTRAHRRGAPALEEFRFLRFPLDGESFEQFQVGGDAVGDAAKWLKDEMECDVVMWNGSPITVTPPAHVEMKVTYTEPGAKGNSAGGRVEKPATIEGGAVINVPIFLTEGETIRVDTDERKYLGRVND